jgi:hypothetical protein
MALRAIAETMEDMANGACVPRDNQDENARQSG